MRSQSRLFSCARYPPAMQSRLGNGGGIDGSLWREHETTPGRPATDKRWPWVGNGADAILTAVSCSSATSTRQVRVAGRRCDWLPGVAGSQRWSAYWRPRSSDLAEVHRCSNGHHVPATPVPPYVRRRFPLPNNKHSSYALHQNHSAERSFLNLPDNTASQRTGALIQSWPPSPACATPAATECSVDH